MYKISFKPFWLVVMTLLVTACSSVPTETERTASVKQGNDCFFLSSVQNWRVLDDRHLIVWAPSRNQAYRLTLNRPLFGLRSAEQLGFEDHNGDGQLCGYGMDGVMIGGALAERATVADMVKLDAVQTENLRHGSYQGNYEIIPQAEEKKTSESDS